MKNILNVLKKNYKFILFLIILFVLLNVHFPYYIDAPGGISNIENKIEISGYESKGSFNLAYVKEYRATIPTLMISLFNKDWNIFKMDEILLDNETDETYTLRDKVFMKESVSNAILTAYKKANKDIKIISNKIVVTYVVDGSNTNIITGDEILSINGQNVSSLDDISSIINENNVGDKLNIKVSNDDQVFDKYAYIFLSDNNKKIGLLLNELNEYETNPKINVKIAENESGSSGGLMMSLAIYNALVSEDITKGKTIVGTGTIDKNGNVGAIGGVEYKIKGAVKSKADLFIVPNENLDEALKVKKKYNYKIKIVGVDTFDEALNYLKNN